MDGDVNANLLALRFNEDSEFECMKKLIAKGADCCAKDSWNYTPLMYAVKGSAPKAIKAVKFIINKNAATLNAKNYFQTTALELAGKLQMKKGFYIAEGWGWGADYAKNITASPPPHTHCALKWGFTRTFPGNQDVTLK